MSRHEGTDVRAEPQDNDREIPGFDPPGDIDGPVEIDWDAFGEVAG